MENLDATCYLEDWEWRPKTIGRSDIGWIGHPWFSEEETMISLSSFLLLFEL